MRLRQLLVLQDTDRRRLVVAALDEAALEAEQLPVSYIPFLLLAVTNYVLVLINFNS